MNIINQHGLPLGFPLSALHILLSISHSAYLASSLFLAWHVLQVCSVHHVNDTFTWYQHHIITNNSNSITHTCCKALTAYLQGVSLLHCFLVYVKKQLEHVQYSFFPCSVHSLLYCLDKGKVSFSKWIRNGNPVFIITQLPCKQTHIQTAVTLFLNEKNVAFVLVFVFILSHYKTTLFGW